MRTDIEIPISLAAITCGDPRADEAERMNAIAENLRYEMQVGKLVCDLSGQLIGGREVPVLGILPQDAVSTIPGEYLIWRDTYVYEKKFELPAILPENGTENDRYILVLRMGLGDHVESGTTSWGCRLAVKLDTGGGFEKIFGARSTLTVPDGGSPVEVVIDTSDIPSGLFTESDTVVQGIFSNFLQVPSSETKLATLRLEFSYERRVSGVLTPVFADGQYTLPYALASYQPYLGFMQCAMKIYNTGE